METKTVNSACVMADPGVCIGCRTCMAACLAKHDVVNDVAASRLNLVTTLAISAPVTCRHCADAPCAAVCPTGALYHDGGRIAIDDSRCIGCRGCVMACPYGAVDIVMRDVSTTMGDLVLGSSERPAVIKCDLCYDRPSGPACIEACPTKSLILVDKKELEERTRQKNRAAALHDAYTTSIPINSSLS